MDNIGIIKTSKFKNNAISLVVPVSLEENVTGYNVLAQVLKRGTKSFHSSSEIARYLQDMYGANFDIMLSKIGNKLFVIFYVSFMDNRFTLYKEDLWDKAIHLLNELIYHPLLKEDDFEEEIIAQEILNHRLYIESIYDDKGHYSMNRVMELGLHDSYRIPEYGTILELDKIDRKVLMDLWEELKGKEAFCYASGNIKNEEEVLEKVSSLKILSNRKNGHDLSSSEKRDFNRESGEVFEKMKINQGKMSLLYNTNNSIFHGDYFALVLFNSIFGGGAHSKLFNEVREKHSLAYSIYSSFDKFAGVMTIGAGTDFKNFRKAKELIDEEIGKMKKGEFSQEDIEVARTKVISSLNAMSDSIFNTSNYLIALRVFGIDYTIGQVIDGLKEVTKERIMNVAENLEFICAHYLDGEDKDGEHERA
ncbi:EF-P 5-aminopentanol modification-associated protein YfmF [Proteiniclasticum sp. C24MP]|uniref:EF-P 5-aminopentanol modification-associated protein YfmF n=1 Tax=Proteiniclasticum sp. C24MP TaxID=3374101 RepID=UPI003753EC34